MKRKSKTKFPVTERLKTSRRNFLSGVAATAVVAPIAKINPLELKDDDRRFMIETKEAEYDVTSVTNWKDLL